MTPTTIQRRLMTSLVAAIYAVAEALGAVIDTIARQPTRPWTERARYSDRFYAIIRELLAVTARIRPATLSRNPVFPSAPPRLAPQGKPARPARPRREQPGNKRHLAPARMLSARQLAQRLANLLAQLERLALEAGAAIPDTLRHQVARIRALAGCAALPSPTPAWERAG